jgi:hypothetical protein
MALSKWVDGKYRTPLGHKLVLSVDARLKARGLTRDRRKAVDTVLGELQKDDPSFKAYKLPTLRWAYYQALPKLPPLRTKEDGWRARLAQWGMPPEASRALVDRLIKIVTVKLPSLGLAYIDLMFDKVTRVRRLQAAHQRKIAWLEHAADGLENPRPYFPIRPWDQASNRNIELIGAALRDGLSNVGKIAAHTGIKPRTTQDLLVFMASTGAAVRKRHGYYGPPQKGAAAYVRPGEAVLKCLKEFGPASPAELRDRTGLTKTQVTGAVHWLWRRAGKIIRPRPNLYALPGTVTGPPHVYAHDAIIGALRSGEKSVPELEAITGKNRGAIWQALRRRLRDDGMIKQLPFRFGHAGRPGMRGRVAVFALSAKGWQHAEKAA